MTELDQLFIRFFKVAYDFGLAKAVSLRPRYTFTRTENRTEITSSDRPDAAFALVANFAAVVELPKFVALYDFICADPALKKALIFRIYGEMPADEVSNKKILWELCYKMAYQLFPEFEDGNDWKPIAAALVQKTLKEGSARVAQRLRSTVLIRVKCPEGSVRIGDYVLRDISQRELDQLAGNDAVRNVIRDIWTVMERRIPGPLSQEAVVWPEGDEGALLNTLRLHFDGFCWALPTYESMDSVFGVGAGAVPKTLPTFVVLNQMGPSSIEIRSADQAELTGLFNDFVRSSRQRKFAIASRRWDFANEREQDADKILDHWIAIEALFGDKGDDTTFKLALRFAGFVGTPADERVRLFKDCKKAYGVRSDIAHGSSTLTPQKMREEAVKVRQFARSALLAAMNAGPAVDLTAFELELLKK